MEPKQPAEILNFPRGETITPEKIDRSVQEKVLALVDEKHQNSTVVHEASGLTADEVFDALSDSEIGTSRLFTKLNKNRFCLNTSLNRWYVYKGSAWRLDQRAEHIDACRDLYQLILKVKQDHGSELTEKAEKFISGQLLKMTGVNEMQNILKQAASGKNGLGVVGEEFDKSLQFIGSPNGIIDLETGALLPDNPELCITKQVGAEYDSSASEPKLFKSFLEQIFAFPLEKEKEEERIRREGIKKEYVMSDEEFEGLCAEQRGLLIAYIQRLFGYTLMGSAREHILICFLGNGRNGKGVLLRTVISALGDYAGEIQPGVLLNSNKSPGAPSPEIGDFKGMRLAVASETNQGQFFDTSSIKRLTGGDTLVSRSVYGKEFIRFKPSHTIVLQTNFRPNAPAEDSAFWARMHVVPFLRCFVENPDAQNRYHAKIDKDLENKLLEELPGILKWIVEGARLYMEHGLKAPACVKNAVEEYRSSRDQISDFMYECCEQGDRFKIRATNLVKAFNGWRKDQGQSRPMSAAVVTERLERKGIIKGKSNITVYKGLKLNDEGEEYLKPTNERKTGFVFEILLRQALWLHLRYPIHLILTR